jgi:hypothetical protein
MCDFHPTIRKRDCFEEGCCGSRRCIHGKYMHNACDECYPPREPYKREDCSHGKGLRNACKDCGRASSKASGTAAKKKCDHGKLMVSACKDCGRVSSYSKK